MRKTYAQLIEYLRKKFNPLDWIEKKTFFLNLLFREEMIKYLSKMPTSLIWKDKVTFAFIKI